MRPGKRRERLQGAARAVLLTLLALAAAAACLGYLGQATATALAQPGVVVSASPRRRLASRNSKDSKGSKGGKTPPSPPPCPSLWSIAKEADDLQFLVAVHRHTKLQFFQPFAKGSRKKAFTLLAPTDAAWNATFATASDEEQDALRRGFAALLLYHQILTAGMSAQQFAARYDALSALGPSIGKDMEVDMDKVGGEYWASGQAPDNYARVVREHEACGAHLIVVDEVLMPIGVAQLPQLQTEQPINDTTWAKLMAIIGADGALGGAPAPLPEPAPAPAPAPAWLEGPPPGAAAAAAAAAAESLAGAVAGSVDSSSVHGGSGGSRDDSGEDAAGSPAPHSHHSPQQQQQQQQSLGSNVWEVEPSPPAPPGVPPDCASLAATGQLMRGENGSLATDRCHPSITSAVLSSGGTQTVVSDARQKANSLLVAIEPPAPAPPASAATPAALAGGWAAALVAATLIALWLEPVRIGRPT